MAQCIWRYLEARFQSVLTPFGQGASFLFGACEGRVGFVVEPKLCGFPFPRPDRHTQKNYPYATAWCPTWLGSGEKGEFTIQITRTEQLDHDMTQSRHFRLIFLDHPPQKKKNMIRRQTWRVDQRPKRTSSILSNWTSDAILHPHHWKQIRTAKTWFT